MAMNYIRSELPKDFLPDLCGKGIFVIAVLFKNPLHLTIKKGFIFGQFQYGSKRPPFGISPFMCYYKIFNPPGLKIDDLIVNKSLRKGRKLLDVMQNPHGFPSVVKLQSKCVCECKIKL